MEKIDLKKGDSVTYFNQHGVFEHGVVKKLGDTKNKVFVVYDCAGNWEDYDKYTAQNTEVARLKKGWLLK